MIFYVATLIFAKKNHDDIFSNDLNANEIQYDEIIIGSMFDKSGEYYVLLLEEDDPYKEFLLRKKEKMKDKCKYQNTHKKGKG